MPDNENQNPEEELSFEERFKQVVEKLRPYVVKLWDSRKKLVIFNAVVLALTLAYLIFLTKPYYKSTITIFPDYGNKGADMMGGLSGLASLAGLSGVDASPTMVYQNLVTSEAVISLVVNSEYQTEKFAKPVNLLDYFEIKPDQSLHKDLQQRKMFLQLYEGFSKTRIVADLDRMTKILNITVEMPESRLCADVANKITESLNNYITTQRRSFATEQRRYLQNRVTNVKDTLTYFEEKLKDFRSQNRMVLQSPDLLLEQARLIRNVEIHQLVYGELVKQLEVVKLQEVKDTPVLNIKEVAKDPIFKTGPKRFTTMVIIIFLSVLFSSVYFIFINTLKKYAGIVGIGLSKVKRKKTKEVTI
jgi:uncharacterized protein involved in exopolysaccharide biosynthesis